ncbi:GreA/GreB family elongation factor [Streptomyces sp. NPDC090106]|uniref:GreA/GreB family elongation factor n=1 Tax=Streptomyces sp. NPDC090106 TaxID=3365946 RepID=UPI0038012B0C
MTGGPEPISAAARTAIERELSDLRTERDTVLSTLRDGGGDESGDRADQADELERATELARLDRRIAELDGRLREAAVAGPASTDRVGVGSSVTVRFSDGTDTTVRLGEIAEAHDPTLVTVDSPLGRALLGHHAGDVVEYVAPGGRTSATVVSVNR